VQLTFIDWLIMLVYFVFVLGIGFALKRYMRTSNDFFLAGRSIPAWICGLDFISANLGAQEVIGMGAWGAKYGIATADPEPAHAGFTVPGGAYPAELGLSCVDRDQRGDRAGVHLSGRPDRRDLQRGAAVFPDRG
jgi:hypothetical protein